MVGRQKWLGYLRSYYIRVLAFTILRRANGGGAPSSTQRERCVTEGYRGAAQTDGRVASYGGRAQIGGSVRTRRAARHLAQLIMRGREAVDLELGLGEDGCDEVTIFACFLKETVATMWVGEEGGVTEGKGE